MPYNGSGLFNPLITFQDNTPATAEDQNSQDEDFASGLSNVMTRDGQAPATANLSLGGFQLNEVGNGVANGDAVNFSQLTTIILAASPTGQLISYAGTTAPTGYFLCDGQAVSRTTYANLFTVIGTTWGSGDGTTTFNVPDLRGRLLAGADNMGGTPANILTGYALGTTGGTQTVTLTAAELPVSAYADTGHTHLITDPGHVHTALAQVSTGFFSPGAASGPSISGNTGSSTTGITIQSGTANITNAGGGGSHPNIQPTAAINILIRY